MSRLIKKLRRHRLRTAVCMVEGLEARQLLATATPTDYEQYMLELLNRARANPGAEATRLGIALNEGVPAQDTIADTPKQPLAFNVNIIAAARAHSQEMIDFDYFSHDGLNGSQPWDRMAEAGYAPLDTFSAGENIGWAGQTLTPPPITATVAQIHNGLFIDLDYPGRGHRVNMMTGDFREIGIGIVTGVYTTGGKNYNAVMATQDFGTRSATPYITGVVYTDAVTADSFYTPGEGLGGITITATRSGVQYQTTTWSSGGYSLPVTAGTYTVTASGGGLASPITYTNVVVGTLNVKRDFLATGDTTAPTATLSSVNHVTTPGGTSTTFVVSYADNNAIDVSTIDANDVQVTGGAGPLVVTLVSVNNPANGTPRLATYSVAAPGGTWDAGDNATYTIAMKSGQVLDLGGNAVVAGNLGTLSVNIPDTQAPTAQLQASNITSAGGTTATFFVTYTDNLAVARASIGSGNVVVSRPGGGTLAATFVQADQSANAPAIVAGYRISAPGGVWDSSDNGEYTVVLLDSQVRDTSNNFVPGGTLGSFTVNISNTPPPTDTVGPSGTLNATDITTAGGTSLQFTVTYTDNAAVLRSSLVSGNLTIARGDGATFPVTFISADQAGNAATIVATYRLDAPGGDWDTADNGTYTVNLNAASVRDINTNAAAAGALGVFNVNIPVPAPVDTTPPTAVLKAAAVKKAAKVYKFTVTYTDAGAVRAVSLATGNIQVTGPKKFKQVAKLVKKTSLADAGNIVATYSIVPSGGMWNKTANGTYNVLLLAGQVADHAGNSMAAARLGTFKVTLA